MEHCGTWDSLTQEQRDAILAYTREAPDDAPNGPEEQAMLDMEKLLDEFVEEVPTWRVAGIMARLCEASANQVRALRLAFGLAEDGVTPAVTR